MYRCAAIERGIRRIFQFGDGIQNALACFFGNRDFTVDTSIHDIGHRRPGNTSEASHIRLSGAFHKQYFLKEIYLTRIT